MNIARIIDGTVVNVEVASQEWLDGQSMPGVEFVPYTAANPACIGYPYDPITGTFAQPEPEPVGRGSLDVPKDVDNTVTLDTVTP